MSEWFDIYDDALNPIGQATREETHAKGYWHATVHCWLYELRDEELYVIFQRRQKDKDTNPLCYDITVAGHLSAGESVHDAVRELKEEIGITTSFQHLKPIMVIKEDVRGVYKGQPIWDREISHVFALANPVPMHLWRLQQEEVMAIYAAPLTQLQTLFQGHIDELQVSGYALNDSGELVLDNQLILAEQFVPRQRSYYLDVLAAITKIAAQS